MEGNVGTVPGAGMPANLFRNIQKSGVTATASAAPPIRQQIR